jgi:hypothetical protein
MAGKAIADQALALTPNDRYKLTLDVTNAVDTLQVDIGASLGGNEILSQDISVLGSYTFYFETSTSAVYWLRIWHEASPASSGNVDNVSVKLVEYLPGQRTVYIEMDPETQSDGLASEQDKDNAREYITYDPDTGQTRQALGLTDETLWVESIYRTAFYVEVVNLDVESNQEAACKADIEETIENYLRAAKPFIDGLDPPATKNDTITSVSLSREAQDVAEAYGASIDEVRFGSKLGQYLPQYTLNEGETAKTATVTYPAE